MDYKVFSLSSSDDLTDKVCGYLGIKKGNKSLDVFSDGEMSPNFDESVRNLEVFLISSTFPHDSFIELLLTIDAAKRAGAFRINCIIPYLAYARQDRKDKSRGAIGSKVMIDALENAGADNIISIDLHARQIEGFFSKQNLYIDGRSVFYKRIEKLLKDDKWVICSPDAGGFQRVNRFSKKLDSNNITVDLAVINKRRDKPNSIASMDLVGDVKDKNVLIIDDMVDTAGSLVKSSNLLLESGAKNVYACITHGVLSGDAYKKISDSKIKKLFISDTIPVQQEKDGVVLPENIEVVSCARTLAAVIKGLVNKLSISQEFQVYLILN
jgi:ribose-phosphate pyrophosphokinase